MTVQHGLKPILLCLAFATASTMSAYGAQPATDYKKLEYPKLHDIVIPEVTHVTLPNGMRLLLLEDHELPLISISARIRVGSIYEPADKIGLADITGEVMRTGGTHSKTGDELDDQLEQIAASVETSIGLNVGYASVDVLKEHIDTGLAVLADVLMNPEFRQDKIDLAKMQIRSAISRRNDSPGGIARREFAKLIYGPNSVYARQAEYATIDRVSRDDLIAFHKRFYGPNNTMMAIWGDFDTKAMQARIEKAFAGWARIDAAPSAMPKVDYGWKSTVNLAVKPDLNQSNIYLGHIGGLASDPDYFALSVMNQILGGGFTGRLFKNVRSREGLAYSVSGAFGANYDYPGTFAVGCQTKAENTVHAIRAMIDEVKKITEAEVTDEELALAKDSFLNSYVFNFSDKGQIVTRMLTYEYYGYPADFLQKIKSNVEKVTKADVLRVAKAHLRPGALQVLVVGRPAAFDGSLASLGTVNELNITIPPAGGQNSEH
jgi:zinc protease